MMSNFRSRFPAARAAVWAIILAGALAAAGGARASDAPAPARPAPAAAQQPTAVKTMAQTQRVKIASVSARVVTSADPMVSSLVAEAEKSVLREPVLVSVQVADAFTDLERSASPVIVVNGQPIGDSIVPFSERNRVVALLRDGTRLQQPLQVQVGWLGDFERTLSEPVQAQVAR